EQLRERLSDDLKSPSNARSNRLREWFLSGHYALQFPRLLGAAGLASLILAFALLMRWHPSELSKLAYVEAEPVSAVSLPGRSKVDLERGSYKDWYHRGRALLRDSQFWIFDRVNRKKLEESIRCLEKAKGLAEVARDDGYVAQ